MRGGGAGGRESERSRGKEEGRTRSLIPLPLKALPPPLPHPPMFFFSCSPLFVCATLACVAGGISVGLLYCFGGGAARRVGIQVNLKSLPRGFAKKFPGHKNPANYAGKCYPHYPNVHLKLPVIKLVFFVDYWGKPNTYALFFAGHLKLFFVIDHWGN